MKKMLLLLIACCTILGTIACSSDNTQAQQQIKTHAAIAAGTQNLTLQGPSGKLMAILETPAVAPTEQCPLVILMHGLTSFKNDGIIVRMASQLKENGIASIRFDFNGHGQSDGKFTDMTITKEKEDAIAVYHYVRSLDYVSKIGALGHSQGGLICSLFVAEMKDKISAAVMLAPGANIPSMVQAGVALLCQNDPSRIPESFPYAGRTLGKAYLTDAFYLKPFEVAKEYRGPVLLLHGTADSLVPISISEQYSQVYNNPEFIKYPGDSHEFRRSLNEAAKASVDFLAKHLK